LEIHYKETFPGVLIGINVDGMLSTFRKEGLDKEPNGISHVEYFYAIVHLDE